MNKNSNLPKNDSIWVVFDLKVRGVSEWFDSKDEALNFINNIKDYIKNSYSEPIKFTKDF